MIVNLFVTSCDDFRKVLTETSSLKSKLRGKLEFGEETPSAEVVRASWASPAADRWEVLQQTRTRRRDQISGLALERLGVGQEELERLRLRTGQTWNTMEVF